MRMLFIGTDRTIFVNGSGFRTRMTHLAARHDDTVDYLVFTTKGHGISSPDELAPHGHAYPTNSHSRLLYGWDALRATRGISRPDVIAVQDPFETGLIALLIARRFGVPLVVEAHTDFLAPEFSRHSLLNRIRVAIAGFVLRRASAGNAVNESLRDRILKRYRLRVPFAVLPLYVETHTAGVEHVPHPRFGTTLLWVGRFEREKDPERALTALAAARMQNHDVGLVMVGSGRLAEELKKKTTQLGIFEWVEWIPWASPEEVAKQYCRADLLLVTSKYEGYGMVIVEALARGVPVLSTDVGIAREAGALIAEGDYARAVADWLRGPRMPGKLNDIGYRNEEDYQEQLRAFYASIAKTI